MRESASTRHVHLTRSQPSRDLDVLADFRWSYLLTPTSTHLRKDLDIHQYHKIRHWENSVEKEKGFDLPRSELKWLIQDDALHPGNRNRDHHL